MPLRDISSSGLTVSSFRPVTVAANVMSKSQYNTQTSPASGVGAAPVPVGLQNQTDAVIRDNGSRLPSLKDPSGVYSVLMTDSDMALTKRKFVKVSSVGEIELSPDRIEFCVQITSTKPDMTAAKESIRKRDEYIMLALKKLGVPDTGVSTTTMVKRYKLEDEAEDNDDVLEVKILRDAEKQLTTKNKKSKKEKKNVCNNNDEDPLLSSARVKVIKELYVVCGSLNMYMELFSIVNEKLDQQVNVSPPVIRITPENIQQQSYDQCRIFVFVKVILDMVMVVW